MSEQEPKSDEQNVEKVENVIVEEEKIKKDYSLVNLRGSQSVADIGREATTLHHLFGSDLSKRGDGNIHLIENDRSCYISGNSVVFQNLASGETVYLLGIDQGGIGCMCIHPSKKIFAVGGKGLKPKIYIYSYPEMEIIKIMEGGAERGFSCLAFNPTGLKLASVAMAPDYMLTVWDWEDERIALHSKAFGQEIFSVKFSLDDELRLTTSGTGHIRFWKMAATFTGLKLQGHIGKFGKVELSDVDSFVELPDGKVLSSTEVGAILVWEGNFIKCRLTQIGDKLCHDGTITYIDYDRSENTIITAGIDGYIRWWDFGTIDVAEVDSDISMNFEIMPIAEYKHTTGIKRMLDSGIIDTYRFFVVIDDQGFTKTLKFPLNIYNDGSLSTLVDVVHSLADPTVLSDDVNQEISRNPTIKVINQSHYGEITGLDISPIGHLAATCGIDGMVRFWDYINRSMVACRQFSTAATSLRWLPSSISPGGQEICVGFADGIVRVLTLCEDTNGNRKIKRKMAIKPHNLPVLDISFKNDATIVATTGKDGIIFFLNSKEIDAKGHWAPIRFITLSISENGKAAPIYCEKIDWKPNDDNAILCNCSDQILREVDLNELLQPETLDKEEDIQSFEAFCPITEFIPKLPILVAAPSVASVSKDEKKKHEESKDEKKKEEKSNDKDKENVPIFVQTAAKVTCASYVANIVEGESSSIIAGTLLQNKSSAFNFMMGEEIPKCELNLGVYSSDGKEYLKNPSTTFIRYSNSNKYVVIGTSDGSVILRPAKQISTFVRISAHNSFCGGVCKAVVSFDDSFVISAGKDGLLSIYRIQSRIIKNNAFKLAQDIDAGVYTDVLIKPVKKVKELIIEPVYLSLVYSDDSKNDVEAFKNEPVLDPVPEISIDDPNVMESGDIVSGSYSIQDAKLKSEEDAKKVTAEDVKDQVRVAIDTLRNEYKDINNKNLAIPEVIRLPYEKMAIDGEYLKTMENLRLAELEEVHRESEHQAEKVAALRKKITYRLNDNMLVDDMTLYSFGKNKSSARTISKVKSLRSQGVDLHVKILIKAFNDLPKAKENDARLVEELKVRTSDAVSLDGKDNLSVTLGSLNSTVKALSLQDAMKATQGSSNAQARRDMRKERKLKLANHIKEKPNENDDDERDVSAIKVAEKTLGDYKLKSAADYEVSEEQRTNAIKKRCQLAQFENTMVSTRLAFNEKFLALRSQKRQVIYSIQRNNARIREIDVELGQVKLSESLWEPTLDAREYGDDLEEITEAELALYKKIRASKPWEKAEPPPHSITTGTKTTIKKKSNEFVTDRKTAVDLEFSLRIEDPNVRYISNINPSAVAADNKNDESSHYYDVRDNGLNKFTETSADEKRFDVLEQSIPLLMLVRDAKKVCMRTSAPTSSQLNVRNERRRRLEFERNKLLEKNDQNLSSFEFSLEELRTERHKATADLKLAELKILVVFQEYQLLQTFENKDTALSQKKIKIITEMNESTANISENKIKLAGKQEELKEWTEKNNQLLSDLRSIVHDSNPFSDQLNRIFKKKIKRVKVTDGGEEDMEEEDEEEEADDDDDDDDADADDSCPLGCDNTLYEKVLDLRERRVDIEESQSDISKIADELKKTIDRATTRSKQIIKDNLNIEQEIHSFQLQKQAALNKIEVMIALSTSQLYAFQNSGQFTSPRDVKEEEIVESITDGPESTLIDVSAPTINPNERILNSQFGMKTHVLFNNEALKRLDARIAELHIEADQARLEFKELRKERVRLTKEREIKQVEIDALRNKCTDMQMLKFGRIIDVDELEAGSDRTKENEAEKLIVDAEETNRILMFKLTKEIDELTSKLSLSTKRNTELLNVVANLTESKLEITRELNVPTPGGMGDNKFSEFRDKEERKRITAYVELQAREIEALRSELTTLKRKDAPPLMPIIPLIGNNSIIENSGMTLSESISALQSQSQTLPPIPNPNQKGSMVSGSTISKEGVKKEFNVKVL